jgi:hypothetical protein
MKDGLIGQTASIKQYNEYLLSGFNSKTAQDRLQAMLSSPPAIPANVTQHNTDRGVNRNKADGL